MVYLAEILYGSLLGPWFSELSKWKKSVLELGHSDQLSVYQSIFAGLPISHKTLNRLQSNSVRMI